jgi:hypothetical protein
VAVLANYLRELIFAWQWSQKHAAVPFPGVAEVKVAEGAM